MVPPSLMAAAPTSELQSHSEVVSPFPLGKELVSGSLSSVGGPATSRVPRFVIGPPWIRSASFFFNDTATTEIYSLSLHDALPISLSSVSLALTVTAPLLRAA